jgi:hypothetical protein
MMPAPEMTADAASPAAVLRAMAKAALAQTNNYEAAAASLLELASADAALYAELVGPYELPAALALIRDVGQSERRTVWSRPTAPDARAAILARGVTETLMDFRLPGGMRLGDAMRADVEAAATFYADHAADMAHKARWLQAIAEKTPASKRVADALDADALAKLKEATA